MGLIGSYFELRKMTKEIEKKSDVGGSMAQMQLKMNQLNASMAQGTVAQAGNPANRVSALATVSSASLTGMQVNQGSVVTVQLLVMLPGGIPTPAVATTLADPLQLARLQPGAQVSVTLDPSIPNSAVIQWT